MTTPSDVPPNGPQAWGAPSGPAVPGPPPTTMPPTMMPPSMPPPNWTPAAWAPPQPITGLGVAVIALAALHTAVSWAYTLMSFPAQAEAERILAEGGDPWAAFQPADSLSLLDVPVLVVAWVLTSVWLGRAHRAARATDPAAVRRSPVWVWLGWVVPFVNLWFPKQIVDDSWKVAAAQPGRRPPLSTGLWWGFWLASTIAARFTNSTSLDVSETGYTPELNVLAAALTTVALVAWVRIVRGLSAAHDGTRTVVPAAG